MMIRTAQSPNGKEVINICPTKNINSKNSREVLTKRQGKMSLETI
jgi:hypothetical protein